VSKNRVKRCESCNEELKHRIGCMNCEEESILKTKKVIGEFKKSRFHSERDDIKNQKQTLTITLNLGNQNIEENGK